MNVRLAHYDANARMATHAHDLHQISFLLAGEILEQVDGRRRRLSGPSKGQKPRGLKHSNQYGPHGALVLSLNVGERVEAEDEAVLPADWNWRTVDSRRDHESALTGLLLAGDDDAKSLSWQLLACGVVEQKPSERVAPRWLHRVRDRLDEATDGFTLDQAANDAGIHPVYLSRVFAEYFDAPPSLYRQRVKVARAVKHIRDGADLAESATLAGFSDQSHLTRTLKREVGVTPGRMRTLFRAA